MPRKVGYLVLSSLLWFCPLKTLYSRYGSTSVHATNDLSSQARRVQAQDFLPRSDVEHVTVSGAKSAPFPLW